MALLSLSCAVLVLGLACATAPGRAGTVLRSHLQLTAANVTSAKREVESAAKLDADADTCGCARENVCTCGAQLKFLGCVQKACQEKKCDCPDKEKQMEQLCSSGSVSCTSDLDVKCGKSTSCKGLFNQASDGVVGFTLDTDYIGEEVYCGPFGKCQGDLQLSAQLHRAYKGLRLQCQIKDKKVFTSCDEEAVTNDVKCSMPMVQGFKAEESIVGKCWLSEGQKAVTKDAWFTITNTHGKMKAKKSAKVKSGASSAGGVLLGVLAAAACSLWLA